MKKLIICLVSIMMIQGCHIPQFPQFKGKYAQFLDNDEQEVQTLYHTVLSKKPDGSFVFRQFFPETMTMTKLITYKDDQKTKHGYSASYSDLGELRSEGHFTDGVETGIWYTSGQGTGIYKDGKKEGEWKITNKEGQLSAIYHYKDDKKDGSFVEYDSFGQIQNEGVYRADTIYEQSKQTDKSTVENIMPMMITHHCNQLPYPEKAKCSERAMLEYIYKTLRYPTIARDYGVQGQSVVQFTVDEDGSIQDVNVLIGLCQSLKDEVIRVVKTFPPWSPGYINGKPVKIKYTLPIKFTLNY
jgi:TonB family protein